MDAIKAIRMAYDAISALKPHEIERIDKERGEGLLNALHAARGVLFGDSERHTRMRTALGKLDPIRKPIKGSAMYEDAAEEADDHGN